MTLRKILALTCLLLPMMASAHQFETASATYWHYRSGRVGA